MKQMRFTLSFCCVLLMSGFCLPALAGASSGSETEAARETRNRLIEKLSGVQLNLSQEDAAQIPVTLRLADLFSERARQDSLRELESGCVKCTAGVADRKRAIALYQGVLARLKDESAGRVMLQMGMLYELTGQADQATELYLAALKDPRAQSVRTQAELALGEVYFRRNQFPQARSFFERVDTGRAAYRTAWCFFNEAKPTEAIAQLKTILKTPRLMATQSQVGGEALDRQFQEEVSRDLATFIGRQPHSVQGSNQSQSLSQSLEELWNLSPDSVRKQNLVYLANEFERLGSRPAAIQTWQFVLPKHDQPEKRLEGQIRLAQMLMEEKQLKLSLSEFEKGVALWAQLGGCGSPDCAELKTRFRKFVTDWNRQEKTSPSAEVIQAYQAYLQVFPSDVEMRIWLGQAHSLRKDYAQAVEQYFQAAQNEKSDEKSREGALLSAIEGAELSQDRTVLMKAYDQYLQQSTLKTRLTEVSYQKAKLLYDLDQFEPASAALREVALSQDAGIGARNLKKQAADLSLDALVLLKNRGQDLVVWAREYAARFPEAKEDFLTVARKTVLSESKALAEGPQADLERAWQKLQEFPKENVSNEDLIAWLKNRIILASQTKRVAEARASVNELLLIQGLSPENQKFALEQKAYLSERLFDFVSAIDATEKMPVLPADERMLKLVLLAQLAGKDPRPYQEKFLKETKQAEKARAMAVELIRSSPTPEKDFTRFKTWLKSDPAMLSEAALIVLSARSSAESTKTSDLILREVKQVKGLAETEPGQWILRYELTAELKRLLTLIEKSAIDTKTQASLARTLKARIQAVESLEKLAAGAIQLKDWTSQLLTLSHLSKKSQSLYEELMALPVPAGLTGDDEAQYLAMLSSQAAPYLSKAQDVQKKVDEFWSQADTLSELLRAAQGQSTGAPGAPGTLTAALTGARRMILREQLELLVTVAPEDRKNLMAQGLQSRMERTVAGSQPTEPASPLSSASASASASGVSFVREIETARAKARENPFDLASVENLLRLERERGQVATVHYLEGRVSELKGHVSDIRPESHEKNQSGGDEAMRFSLILFIVIGMNLSFAQAPSATEPSVDPSKTVTAQPKKSKSSELSFDDLLVQGSHQFSQEMVTTVEDDKVLDALLGVRKDFKDRLERSSARY